MLEKTPQPSSNGAALGRSDEPLVAAQGVKIVKGGRVVLHDIAIEVRPEEIVTLIGPNGAGKSTLVRVLLGLETPEAGTVRRRADLRVGYTPQRFDIDAAIPLTAGRFLTLGGAASEQRIEAALAEVGAERLAERQLARLSGGEFQRVLLARALLREPSLLVLDEPVRGVDYMGEAELYKLIGTIRNRRRCGVLLVSHDLHVVMGASDRVVCINHHVCCQGVPETVAQHPEYQKLFGVEAARSFALYRHHHDHSHDLAGAVEHEHGHEAHEHSPGHAHGHGAHGHSHVAREAGGKANPGKGG
jgi:zinc transport system ATP-binding protein